MTDRNLAIVWAPNLLRSPALESGGNFDIKKYAVSNCVPNEVFFYFQGVAALRGVGVQAVVTGKIISHVNLVLN